MTSSIAATPAIDELLQHSVDELHRMRDAVIAGKAVESIGRQPEAASDIRSSMIVAAALIEGVTFFALLIVFLGLFWSKG